MRIMKETHLPHAIILCLGRYSKFGVKCDLLLSSYASWCVFVHYILGS